MKKNKRGEAAHSGVSRIVRRTWLFASAALGLDIAMLVIGMVLSRSAGVGIVYTVEGSVIHKDDPLAFFGVVAAVVLGINCVLIALMLAGAFSRNKRRTAVILGSVGLLALSLIMIASAAFMALGAPVKSEKYYSYTDESLKLIAEEDEPYFGDGSVSFYMTEGENNKAVLLAKTSISTYADSDERYKITWISESIIQIGFVDGEHYRTLTIPVDRSLLEMH